MGSKKINVAFFLNAAPTNGGGFQYEVRALQILKKSQPADFDFLFFASRKDVVHAHKKTGHNITLIKACLLSRIYTFFLKNRLFFMIAKELRLPRNKRERLIEETLTKTFETDLIYFLSPSTHVLNLINIPYIMTVWDLCHRDFSEFPEVRNNGQFEKREDLYGCGLRKAVAITVDSPEGKKKLTRRYGIDDNRVHVLKFLPPADNVDSLPSIDIKNKYNLSHDYIFYPAQFWAHKNHIYILKAIKLLKEQHNKKIDVVFSGFDKGNLSYILQKAKDFGIDELVHHIGFVADEEIPSLYRQALSLVMPTYFGPTNLPPLEAFTYDCPVCYSDLDGLREQVGEAAFLMDLEDPKSLAQHLMTIITDKKIVEGKRAKGKEILHSWNDEDFSDVILNIIKKYKHIRECWQ